MEPTRNISPLSFLGYSVLILVPSFDTFLKYFGVAGVITYFAVGTALLFVLARYILPKAERTFSERTAFRLAIITLISVAVVAAVVYPEANTGRFGGGSDADDALVIATSELLKGNFPYYPRTYLGNLMSPMPGSLLLAIPFVVAGAIYLQTVFWLGVLFFLVRHFWGSNIKGLVLLWILLAFCPTVMQNVVTGADYLANSIFVVFFIWWLAAVSAKPLLSWAGPFLPAVLFGVSLSSRANFLIILPLLFSLLVQIAGWKRAVGLLGLSGAVCAAITLSIWAVDPPNFAPFVSQSMKVRDLESVLPYARFVIPLSGMMLAAILAIRRMTLTGRSFFLYSAVVQIYILLFSSTVNSVRLGQVDLFIGQSGYGMFTLVFAVIAVIPAWMGSRKQSSLSEAERPPIAASPA